MAQAGPTVPIRIENNSGGKITSISLNLRTNPFGQCGALAYSNIANNARLIVKLPKGSWWAYAWIELKGGGSSTAEGYFELRVGDEDLLRLIVYKDYMAMRP
jgi:hypothetical protein